MDDLGDPYYEVHFRGGGWGRTGGYSFADTIEEAAQMRDRMTAEGHHDIRIYRVRKVRSRVKDADIAAVQTPV